MLPCGTPMVIFAGGDNALTLIVCWTRPERYERNHSKLFPATTCDLSWLMRRRRSTVSNALRRSRNTVPVTYPLSILSRTWSVKAIKAVEVDTCQRHFASSVLSFVCELVWESNCNKTMLRRNQVHYVWNFEIFLDKLIILKSSPDWSLHQASLLTESCHRLREEATLSGICLPAKTI